MLLKAWLLAFAVWALEIVVSRLIAPWARYKRPDQASSAPVGLSYSDLLQLRNTELSTLWTRFNLHFLINGGLLSILLTVGTPSLLKDWPAGPYAFGFLLTMLWLQAELAGRHALHTRDSKLGEFEWRFWPRTQDGSLPFSVFGDIPQKHPLSFTAFRLRWQMGVSAIVILVFMMAWSTLVCLTLP